MWKMPAVTADSFRTGLRVRNSLAGRQLTEFIPVAGRRVNWYICGPTVYSDSHLGHAKTYLCFDIVRKILTRHFRYDVHQIMNITNIDDKIIKASAEQGIDYFDFAARWERDFFEVMTELGVELPDRITRVNEFVPEIVAFTAKVLERDFAYVSNGSVYFDIRAFQRAGHSYPKLRPFAAEEQRPTEGELFDEEEGEPLGEKRFKGDFVLWKKAKEGEPWWDSPWGRGRPGWHVECSAMCADTLPSPIDMHSGGDDLTFPHHANELAQSEAFFGTKQWINYFTHTGRMNINGQKMSKSLKNFVQIREVLKTTPPRVLRLFYSFSCYNDVINLDLNSRFGMAWDIDAKFANFFQNLNSSTRSRAALLEQSQKFDEADLRVEELLLGFPALVHKAFCDDFNTKDALAAVQTVINGVNSYLSTSSAKLTLLKMAEERVRDALFTMGFDYAYASSSTNFEGVVDAAVTLRHEVKAAMKAKTPEIVLGLCDQFRDEKMPPFGVKIEDRDTPTWKPCDAGEEKARKERATHSRQTVAAPIDITQLWKDSKFSKHILDEEGIPITDAKGIPISAKDRAFCEKKMADALKKLNK